MKMNEAGRLANDYREWKVEQPFPDSCPSRGPSWNQRVAHAVQASSNQEAIKRHVRQEELGKHCRCRTRPRRVKPAQEVCGCDNRERGSVTPCHLCRQLWEAQKSRHQDGKCSDRYGCSPLKIWRSNDQHKVGNGNQTSDPGAQFDSASAQRLGGSECKKPKRCQQHSETGKRLREPCAE